jgi:hypothetical protein
MDAAQLNTGAFAARLAALSEAHQRTVSRFRARLPDFVDRDLLTPPMVEVLEEHLLRLGERDLNPSNTGNLEDLFCWTLVDTRDPVRAFAQAMADTVKVVPMNDEAELWPPLRHVEHGTVYEKVGDLAGYAPGDKMLIAHTMVAYADPELSGLARRLIRACHPGLDAAGVDRAFARMAVQSQHGPSSTFVLARSRGLTLALGDLYRAAGYDETDIANAQRFYDVCARFDPAWVLPFLEGFIPSSPEWSSWRRQYLDERQRLPAELIYQLSSDTLTNFLHGTLEAGKWTDASVLFSGIASAEEVPAALAKIVNQYIAEHIALHDRPAEELMDAVTEPLAPWGVGFERGRAVAIGGAVAKREEIEAQVAAALARKAGIKR